MIRAILIAVAMAVFAPATHAIPQELPGWSVVETANFRFHFPAKPTVDPAAFSARQERTFEELRKIFGSAPPAKIDFHVWTDDAEGERALGRPLAFARPDKLLIHTSGSHTPGLVTRGGRDNYLKLLKHQTIDSARTIYGASAFDRMVTEFEADLLGAPGAQASGQPPTSPALDALRRKAQERMRTDAATYSREQFQEIERIYQSANTNLRAPEARPALLALVEKYPKANRTGCGVLYLAQMSQGEEKERFLKLAIEKHEDAMYGDGAQVGAFARAQLAQLYAQTNRLAEAKGLVAEITSRFPDAVDHSGVPLVDTLKRMKLIE